MAEQDQYDTEFAPNSVGRRLRVAREVAGLSRADIAARTKIAERHLTAIEEDRFDDLASGTYAVGFARAYARTVGLNEADIAREVRSVLEAGMDEVRPAVTFEPGDPARIPTPRLAWFAALGVVAVVVAIFLFWRSYFTPAVTLPDLAPDAVVAAASGPAPAASAPVALASDPAALASASAPSAQQTVQQGASNGARRASAPAARPAASSAPASERPAVQDAAPVGGGAAPAAEEGAPASIVSP